MSAVGTPKRRSMIEMRSFASPLASSTPKKQKDESSKEPTKDEQEEDVTTVIEVVSKRNYRRDIRLLRLRLDEIKLKIRQQSLGRQQSGIEDKENLCDKQESFFLGIQHDLIETCDQLLSQCRTQDLWAREQQSQAEQMYKSHIDELSAEVTDLRNENSRLKQKLVLIDTKIGEVLGENKFLRWENEQFSQNIVILQQQLNEKTLANNESLAELRCMKTNQAEINRLHNLKSVFFKSSN
ncbi:hypothetical protein M3Y97_00295900 [Aphelenchoides bicaudatus]|nr:hypothetical protein M3Y97_00295900 [Aphelenchoides bicaudatus]